MKALNLILALATPAVLAAGYLPDYHNSQIINEIQIAKSSVDDDDSFRLAKQPYYKSIFTSKELKKLAKAEKLRLKASEYLVLSAASQKQAEDLKSSSPELTDKIQKQISKLEAAATQQELNGLKTFHKASEIYRVVYTNVLNNKTFTAATPAEKTAQDLAMGAFVDYQKADGKLETADSDNTLEVYRAVYSHEHQAVHDQEICFALLNADAAVDYTKYQKPADAASNTVNIAKDSLPQLIAPDHYDFDKDNNVYRTRFHQFEDRLKVSDDDKKTVAKLEADEANAATLMRRAENYGCTADTFRVYAGEASTLAEREYYEQKAQESELNECSNLLKAAKLNVAANNSMMDIYRKYVPKVRNAQDTVGKDFEDQADDLYKLSKTYETMAASQYSHVEQYTQLMEGNEVKLQAIECMENAIASYLGDKVETPSMSLATGASERHNDVAMDFIMDESDGAASATKPVANANKPVATNNANNANKPVANANANKPVASDNANKPVASDNANKPVASSTTSKPVTNNSGAGQSSAATRNPALAASNAAVVSSSFYTKNDQRMQPYSYPKGTVFSVEAGIYKEMPEPVEFPAVDKFIAQNLKGVTPMRYYIGEYQTYDAAYAICAIAKENGYRNAKVVAFVNGKNSDVQAAKKAAEKTSGYQNLVQAELKKINSFRQATTPVAPAGGRAAAVPGAAIPLSQISGEQYVVQISSVPALLDAKAFNVSELFYDRNDAGLYRYYTGASNDVNIAAANLSTMRQAGYQDAYLVRVVDGRNMGAASRSNTDSPAASYPVYRVQIGAYKSSLTDNTKAQIEKLKKAGYAVHTSKSGDYTVVTVGDCGSRDMADKLRKELKDKGYPEAYVVTFVNGVKQ